MDLTFIAWSSNYGLTFYAASGSLIETSLLPASGIRKEFISNYPKHQYTISGSLVETQKSHLFGGARLGGIAKFGPRCELSPFSFPQED
jgi:hypothetical protein